MKFDLGEDLLSREEQNEARDSWINRARVHHRGDELPAPTPIHPPAINTKVLPFQQPQAKQSTETNKESRFARRLRQFKSAKKKALGMEAGEGGAKGTAQAAARQYKRIKRIIQVVKVVTAAGASAGEIFVSAGVFLVTAHGEWIYSKFNAKYPFAPWERWLVITVDIIIFLVLLAIAVIVTVLYQQFQSLGGGAALKVIGK